MANSGISYLIGFAVGIATVVSVIDSRTTESFDANQTDLGMELPMPGPGPADTNNLNAPTPVPAPTPDPVPAQLPPAVEAPKLKYPFKDQSLMDPLNFPNDGGLKLKDPSNLKKDVQFSPSTGNYEITEKIGTLDYRPPTYMTPEEYDYLMLHKQLKSYWNKRTKAEAIKQGSRSLIPKLYVGGEYFDRIFGGNTVDIRPQGTAELIFGVNNSTTQNPVLPVSQRSITTFDFNEKIQLNVVGKIGDKLKLTTNYNTEATFDFENQMKIEYTGYEDEIIKKIDAGNVTLPLTGSLITGSTSLFGIKTQMQFGKLTATTVLSQAKGQKSVINVTGGAQTSNFSITADNYEANRHYFLSQYFRDRFDTAMGHLPVVASTVSVTRVEVWVTNRSAATTNVRNIVAFQDLGEGRHIANKRVLPLGNNLPDNNSNDLYKQLTDSLPAGMYPAYLKNRNFTTISNKLPSWYVISNDYEVVELARQLSPSEYTVNPLLGYISLNQSLNYDEVLGVAFQYTLNGKTYQVGEFSTDGVTSPKPLILKMLKATTLNTHAPIWNLMMKNIYSIGGYQISPTNFRLDVFYNNLTTGVDINFLPDGPQATKPLIQVLGLDRIDQQGDPVSDGLFDFLPGVDINTANGRVVFPSVEPFGTYLMNKLMTNGNPPNAYALKYGFPELYDSTRVGAQQFPQLNRFTIKGSFTGNSSNDIALNAVNIPQGSVSVTAGGIKLTENVDYTVDYTLGRLKIINDGILNSGTPLQISLENNALFSIQSKTMIGTHLDYKVNKDFVLGSTIMNLTERPLTQKVNIGDEPINNTVIGMDGNYRTEAPLLTKLVNQLPFINTKQKSTIVASGEAARIFPGTNSAAGGQSYIDDFEGSLSTIDLKSPQAWSLASIPQFQPNLFPEASFTDSLPSGFNRALLNWYILDPLFIRQTYGLTPSYLTNSMMSNNLTREVLENEIFPNEQITSGLPTNTPMFDLVYYPNHRGPYNYDVLPTNVSRGIDVNGNLVQPATRWGGIMRGIQTTDFEAANIEYLQFWMMDPFNSDVTNPATNIQNPITKTGYPAPTSGTLYVDLGDVSEDVLKDGQKSFENGLPTSTDLTTAYFDSTNFGRVPLTQSLVNAFDINQAARPFQDVGLDGLDNQDEQSFFNRDRTPYLNLIARRFGTNSAAYQNAFNDPSADDYHYYRGTDYDNNQTSILDRYKQFNGPDGNSPATGQANHAGYTESYSTAATTLPNSEDINHDNTLSQSESYFQYQISLRPADLNTVGNNYITDIISTTGQNIKDGTTKPIKWYQFKIPIRSFNLKVGNMNDFSSIRFLRLFFKGVDQPIVCRFARMEFVASQWRLYNSSLLSDGEYLAGDGSGTAFSMSSVSIVYNGTGTPVNYVLPPNIQRQINVQSSNLAQMNEQSLAVDVCGLIDGDARAVYKNLNLDLRLYNSIKMYAHAQAGGNGAPLHNGDLHWFIRIGTDFTDNYYEYEIPLSVTAPGNYNGSDENQQYLVWPAGNELNLSLPKLLAAKETRNGKLSSGQAKLTMRYSIPDGNNTIYVVGNPNLAGVKTIMLGVRNPKKEPGVSGDDGLPKCAEIWFDELRLSDFNENGGWASLGRVKTDFADVGSISLAGNYSTPGWGTIEQKLNQRQQSTNFGFDASSTIELSKFTPAKLGLRIPMYLGYSEAFVMPKWDPLNPDLDLATELSNPLLSKGAKDSLRNNTVDFTQRKSINFTNVKKERPKDKKLILPWDIENFSATYSFTELYHQDVNTQFNLTKTYHGNLTYSFVPKPKSYKPFEKVKMNPKYFSLIKDMNVSMLPTRVGFSTDLDRFYNTSQIRNNTGESQVIIPQLFNKTFTLNRNYIFAWDLTKSLKFDFNALDQARIMEPFGAITTKEQKDSIWNSLRNLGTNTHYKQSLNVNYAIPINKLPYCDFITATARYSGTYDWLRAPFAADSMGNTIQNSGAWQWNGQLNMSTLYAKIPYLKKLAAKPLVRTKEEIDREKEKRKKAYEKALKAWEADTAKYRKPKPRLEVDQPNIVELAARLITSIKTITVNYVDNYGTLLPGYKSPTTFFGLDPRLAGPTPAFVFGNPGYLLKSPSEVTQQQNQFVDMAGKNNWLVHTPSINTAYTNTHTQNFSARTTVEPIPNLKIELNATRNFAQNNSVFYRWNDSANGYLRQTPTETGNFSISIISIKTAFEADNSSHHSQNWENFLSWRGIESGFLGAQYQRGTGLKLPTIGGYASGYGPNSQDVVAAAFLAAYTGHNPRQSDIATFPLIPLPNWRMTYDGLSKFEKMKKYFKSVTLSSAYKSSYNIGSFAQNLYYADNGSGYTQLRDESNNFIPKLTLNTISITESFNPLAKLETVWQNSLLTSIEVTKDRNIAMAMTNINLQELRSNGITIGAGYKIKKLKIKQYKSDLNLKMDLSFKNTITIMRQADPDISQATAGQNIISIKLSADYMLSTRLTVRAFIDRIMNNPVISSSFPTSNTNGGISLRFSLSQ